MFTAACSWTPYQSKWRDNDSAVAYRTDSFLSHRGYQQRGTERAPNFGQAGRRNQPSAEVDTWLIGTMLMFLSASNIYTTHFNVMTYRSALHTFGYHLSVTKRKEGYNSVLRHNW